MKDDLLVRLEDLVNNPTARVPVCLCLDTSGSMEGRPIEELNEGVRLFYEAIKEDETALYSAEISVVTFGVNIGLDLLEKRKEEYKDKGVDYYQPWLVLMTDGGPNGDNEELSRAIRRTVDLVTQKKLTVFPIGIGEEADMNVLAKFSPKRLPLKLQGLKFREFFAWLSKSVSKTSQSTPGETIKLDLEGIKGWGDL